MHRRDTRTGKTLAVVVAIDKTDDLAKAGFLGDPDFTPSDRQGTLKQNACCAACCAVLCYAVPSTASDGDRKLRRNASHGVEVMGVQSMGTTSNGGFVICRDAMAVFAMEAASIISERSLEISFASALSTVSASGLNVNAGKPSAASRATFPNACCCRLHVHVCSQRGCMILPCSPLSWRYDWSASCRPALCCKTYDCPASYFQMQ